MTGRAGDYQVEGAKTVQTLNIGGSTTTTVSLVVGVEGDANWSWMNGNASPAVGVATLGPVHPGAPVADPAAPIVLPPYSYGFSVYAGAAPVASGMPSLRPAPERLPVSTAA